VREVSPTPEIMLSRATSSVWRVGMPAACRHACPRLRMSAKASLCACRPTAPQTTLTLTTLAPSAALWREQVRTGLGIFWPLRSWLPVQGPIGPDKAGRL
jgi:hypothetical protein